MDRSQQQQRRHYPFSAIIGQEDLKLCLVLCAVDPSIGGVLISGDKGTAKSTAARGISRLMPKIEVRYDPTRGALDPYNRGPGGGAQGPSAADSRHCRDDKDEEDASYSESRLVDAPFVDLPIGATEDRVLGSIDFSATLKAGGAPVFAPGLLAAANRGILYVDEVNLLPAHLVDVLLDAAAMGVNTVQREGVSTTHPAAFVLIGTMNPEEGELRPQLLDRFGLMVEVAAPSDVLLRCEVVKQRMHYERRPAQFRDAWEDAEEEWTNNIRAAQERLPNVVLGDDLLLLISRICTEFKVGSLRADITLYKTATALAAWEGRLEVEGKDVRRAAEWVLAHRRRRQPFGSSMDGPSDDELMDQLMTAPPPSENHTGENGETDHQDHQQPTEGSGGDQHLPEDDLSSGDKGKTSQTEQSNQDGDDGNGDDGPMQTFTASKPSQIKKIKLSKKQSGQSATGRRNHSTNSQQKNRYVRSMQTDKPVDLALDATLRSAVGNGLSENGQPIIRSENWRKKVYSSTTDTIILFVVDTSGSMAARKRMETVKGAVLALLADAHQQRDRVGVIAFRGPKAEVLLEPTRSVEAATQALRRLPTGGRTPLAHALSLAGDAIARERRHDPAQAVLLVVLSDGKANVPLPDPRGGVGDAWLQTERAAARLAALAVPTLLLDTDAGHVRVGRGKELSELLDADYLPLEDMTADGVVHTIRQVAS